VNTKILLYSCLIYNNFRLQFWYLFRGNDMWFKPLSKIYCSTCNTQFSYYVKEKVNSG